MHCWGNVSFSRSDSCWLRKRPTVKSIRADLKPSLSDARSQPHRSHRDGALLVAALCVGSWARTDPPALNGFVFPFQVPSIPRITATRQLEPHLVSLLFRPISRNSPPWHSPENTGYTVHRDLIGQRSSRFLSDNWRREFPTSRGVLPRAKHSQHSHPYPYLLLATLAHDP